MKQQLRVTVAHVSALESQLAEARSAIDEPAQTRREILIQTSLACLASTLAGLAFVWLLPQVWEQSPNRERAATVLWFAPLAVGMWLGMKLPGVHLRLYATSGGAFGATFMLTSIVLAFLGRMASPWNEAEDVLTEVFILGTSVLLGILGGLIGDGAERLSRRLRTWAELRSQSDPLRERTSTHPGRRTQRLQALSDLIIGIQPLLTFVAALFAAYLTYLAATETRAAKQQPVGSSAEAPRSGVTPKPAP